MDNYLPHAICFRFNEVLIALHVISDGLIAFSYVLISAILLYFAWRLRFRFRGFIVAFALFILCCGATHAMNIYTVWIPDYWLSGWISAVTALISLFTALTLANARDGICKFIEGRKAQNV